MGWARRTDAGWVEDIPPDTQDGYDLRSRDGALMAYCGWQPVVETPRPVDTATMTSDRMVELVDGCVTVVWQPREWTAGEQAAHQAAQATLPTLEARVAALEALVLARTPPPASVPVWDGAPVEPGGHRIIAGVEWVNGSGTWMVQGPAMYPLGWRQATPPVTAPAWAPGQSVTAGALRTWAGIVYRCVQGHTTATGWEPPSVPALWTIA